MPSKLVKYNYLTVLCLFYERRTFSPLRLPPCGVPRCMGKAMKKRNRFLSIALLAAMGGNSGHSFFCFSFIF